MRLSWRFSNIRFWNRSSALSHFRLLIMRMWDNFYGLFDFGWFLDYRFYSAPTLRAKFPTLNLLLIRQNIRANNNNRYYYYLLLIINQLPLYPVILLLYMLFSGVIIETVDGMSDESGDGVWGESLCMQNTVLVKRRKRC